MSTVWTARRRAHRLVTVPIAITLALAVITTAATPAEAGITGYRITGTGGIGLKVRANATDPNAAVQATLADGTLFTAECAVRGRNVSGNTVWHRISAPASGWISDYYTTTPGFNQFIPGERDCNAAPAPNVSREDRAMAWARSVIGQYSTHGDLGDSDHQWNGWCDNFVAHAYGRRNSGYTSAIVHYNSLNRRGLIHRAGTAPAGALVFFAAVTSINGGSGHVMLSEGNGSYVTAAAPVKRVSLSYPGATYLGWSWADPEWSGR